ncbi:MAG: M48 family metallopeptidase [Syntrophomonadaceae bacterium]|nr:M48 family metallopeptidase [Syntrophomonadaceae bacterium]
MQLSIKYEGKTIYFDVIYRKRKTMAITVEAPDKVTVSVPMGMKEEVITKNVMTKADWIVKKLYEFENVRPIAVNKEFINGESFMYLGINYALQIELNESLQVPEVKIFKDKFIISTPWKDKEIIKKALEGWYRERAREVINERVKYYQFVIGAKPAKVTIKEQKKRWGSCSSKVNLNFNWKLIMAPPAIIDYVVVHEMAHLIHLNHSKQFWDLVESILPDYKERRKWLNNNGYKLSF